MIEKLLHDIYDALAAMLAALAPGAFGSAVAVAHSWDEGLTWPRRLMQWGIGIIVSYYINLGLAEWFGLGHFVAQSSGFVIGLIAFRSAPPFINGMANFAGSLPDFLRDKLTGSKGDSQ